MQERYTAAQVSRILDQALIYQCACPAQVCRAVFELRELFDYQRQCANDTDNDRRVHEAIAAATEQAHATMEACLAQVLEIEGWDPQTLTLPAALRKKPRPV
ncbi:hypothetical protein HK414_08995 [Ramlibacter terrae]|uniref:Uncharacterized protein n=1 Tax=Ramlibacter terrae TaxID=2732511 RepID=A0ABX6P1N0_9BURK|nr:hypothetical protein HK414_08995 [Ramlibacter terrae]